VTAADQPDWVVLRHFDDAMDAEITLNFLRDHDVRVEVRGNSVNGATLNRFITVIDIRLVVPAEDLEHAQEVLTAMTSEATDHPFRGARPPELAPDDSADGGQRAMVQPRHRSAAFILALLVPVAGGHFYARHSSAAIVLALGIVGGLLVAMLGAPQLLIASALLVGIDAVLSIVAVRRFNEGRMPSEGRQRAWAFGAVVLAWGLAIALGS
jgi:hypothetical protein